MMPPLALLLCAVSSAGVREPAAADAIMAKVAANQERASRLRSEFLYRQSLLIRMRRGNHKLTREERSEFTVTPGPKGFEKKLTHFSGRYAGKDGFVAYDRPHYEYKDVDIDGDLISDLADDFTNDRSSRDGIGRDLFPLTAAEQSKYVFRLVGKETLHGREVYRVAFRPKPHNRDAAWAGEVLVDAAEYEPVLVTTRLARGIPFWVKTVLGTNLKYLGFSVAYQRCAGGVWFPVSYGGEFEVKAVFVYKRLISVSLANTGFQRTDVRTRISYGPEAEGGPQPARDFIPAAPAPRP
jgi:hypothetical protein